MTNERDMSDSGTAGDGFGGSTATDAPFSSASTGASGGASSSLPKGAGGGTFGTASSTVGGVTGSGAPGAGVSGAGVSGAGVSAKVAEVRDTVVDQARSLASTATEQAGQKVRSGLDSGKGRAAASIREIASALRGVQQQGGAQGFSGGEGAPQVPQGLAVQYLSTAGERVERLADYLEQTDTREIVRGVEDYARRQPAVFLGATFALGLAVARFLKSSPRAATPSSGHGALTLPAIHDQERALAFGREPFGDGATAGGLGASRTPDFTSDAFDGGRFSSGYDMGIGGASGVTGGAAGGTTSGSGNGVGSGPNAVGLGDGNRFSSGASDGTFTDQR